MCIFLYFFLFLLPPFRRLPHLPLLLYLLVPFSIVLCFLQSLVFQLSLHFFAKLFTILCHECTSCELDFRPNLLSVHGHQWSFSAHLRLFVIPHLDHESFTFPLRVLHNAALPNAIVGYIYLNVYA